MDNILAAQQTQTINSSFLKTLIDGNNAATSTDFGVPFLKEFGYKYSDAPARTAYSQFLQAIELARQFYYPHLAPDEGYELLGYRAAMHFFLTPAGQVIKPLMKVLGPEIGAPRFAKNMENQFAFGTHRIEEIRRGYLRYRAQDVPNPPSFMLGFLRVGAELSGAKDLKFKIEVIFAKDFSIEAFWK